MKATLKNDAGGSHLPRARRRATIRLGARRRLRMRRPLLLELLIRRGELLVERGDVAVG